MDPLDRKERLRLIGSRIRQERERLDGLSQEKLAPIVDSTKRTVIAWEKGESSPNTLQLNLLDEAGFDVLYIATGRRFIDDLTEDELKLVEKYRCSNEKDKHHIDAVATAFSDQTFNKVDK